MLDAAAIGGITHPGRQLSEQPLPLFDEQTVQTLTLASRLGTKLPAE
jgi:hypothetical protein